MLILIIAVYYSKDLLMTDKYVYRRLVRRHWYGKFRLRRRYVIAFVLLLIAVVAYIAVDVVRSGNKTKPPTSAVQNIAFGEVMNTFHSDYFEFQDTGNWVLSKSESTDQKYVYFKYSGVMPVGQLNIYVNQEPIPLDLAASRVLPVRTVNDNRLDVTNVYGHCVSKYGPDELHKIKTVVIEGASMLCDPDTPLYKVVISEVNGDWHLSLKRSNGEPAKFVITYRDITLKPGPEAILRISKSFRAK